MVLEARENPITTRNGNPIDMLMRLRGEQGAAGYILLWILGVPASLLFLIFLLRGCT